MLGTGLGGSSSYDFQVLSLHLIIFFFRSHVFTVTHKTFGSSCLLTVYLFISLTLSVSSCLRPALTAGTNQENAFLQIAAGGHFYDY